MNNFLCKIQRFLKSEDGPTTVEYAIMLALIVAVCLASIGSVGSETSELYDEVSTDIEAVMNGTFDGS